MHYPHLEAALRGQALRQHHRYIRQTEGNTPHGHIRRSHGRQVAAHHRADQDACTAVRVLEPLWGPRSKSISMQLVKYGLLACKHDLCKHWQRVMPDARFWGGDITLQRTALGMDALQPEPGS